MFDKFFAKHPNYEMIEKPSQAEVDQYRGILLEKILHIWQNYGFGIYADGYLRFVKTASFQEYADTNIERIGFDYIPIAASAFGDLFVWKKKGDGFLELYDFRHATLKTLSTNTGLDILFDTDFLDDSFIWEELNASNYHEAKAKLGTPAYDQCYGYFPLLALGGSESVEHVQIVDLKVHMDLMAQVSGPL